GEDFARSCRNVAPPFRNARVRSVGRQPALAAASTSTMAHRLGIRDSGFGIRCVTLSRYLTDSGLGIRDSGFVASRCHATSETPESGFRIRDSFRYALP